MTALSIQPTFPIFTDIDGQPLENGYIWIGTENLDPQTNPINVYWDAALTIAAPQPIRTLAGYPARNGSPARLYVNSDYSIRVQNRNGSTVYSAPAATERYGNIINASGIVYNPAGTGAVPTTVQAKLREYVSIRDFGAVGDGVHDDTAAIQAAINASDSVFFGNGDWTINATIVVPAGRYIDFGAGNVVVDCTGQPVFSFGSSAAGAEGLTIRADGGSIVSGTADSFLKLEGSNNFGISPLNFARQIRLDGLHISSANINKFIHMVTAVRQVFVSKCQVFTPNGVLADGKCVEVMFDKSVIFSATGAAGTYCFKLSSALGTNLYNEGWTISDSTIDAAENAFDIADIFVFEVDNSYIGRPVTIRKPTTTTHTREIIFNGNVIFSSVTFASSAAGILTYAIVSDNIFIGGGVNIGGNHSQISVRGNKFESSSSGVAVTIGDNCNNITCENLDIDSTYIGGIIMSGTNGAEITVRDISYAGTGSSLFSTRPVLVNDLDMGDGTSIAEKQSTVFIQGSYPITNNMGSITVKLAKGQTGKIMGVISASGLDAGITIGVPNQRFDISAPASLVLPSAVGNSAAFLYPLATSGMFSFCIPFHCTADVASAVIAIKNATGNTATVQYHSWFGLVRD